LTVGLLHHSGLLPFASSFQTSPRPSLALRHNTISMPRFMRHAQGHFRYNAAKGATVHLAKLMSYEFKDAGVRVNSIAPGYSPSWMTIQESDETHKSKLGKERLDKKGHFSMGMEVSFFGEE
jgi:NAD(P)-dependent dehydrogenase (short-subunit alcohol dehydrogenase family)